MFSDAHGAFTEQLTWLQETPLPLMGYRHQTGHQLPSCCSDKRASSDPFHCHAMTKALLETKTLPGSPLLTDRAVSPPLIAAYDDETTTQFMNTGQQATWGKENDTVTTLPPAHFSSMPYGLQNACDVASRPTRVASRRHDDRRLDCFEGGGRCPMTPPSTHVPPVCFPSQHALYHGEQQPTLDVQNSQVSSDTRIANVPPVSALKRPSLIAASCTYGGLRVDFSAVCMLCGSHLAPETEDVVYCSRPACRRLCFNDPQSDCRPTRHVYRTDTELCGLCHLFVRELGKSEKGTLLPEGSVTGATDVSAPEALWHLRPNTSKSKALCVTTSRCVCVCPSAAEPLRTIATHMLRTLRIHIPTPKGVVVQAESYIWRVAAEAVKKRCKQRTLMKGSNDAVTAGLDGCSFRFSAAGFFEARLAAIARFNQIIRDAQGEDATGIFGFPIPADSVWDTQCAQELHRVAALQRQYGVPRKIVPPLEPTQVPPCILNRPYQDRSHILYPPSAIACVEESFETKLWHNRKISRKKTSFVSGTIVSTFGGPASHESSAPPPSLLRATPFAAVFYQQQQQPYWGGGESKQLAAQHGFTLIQNTNKSLNEVLPERHWLVPSRQTPLTPAPQQQQQLQDPTLLSSPAATTTTPLGSGTPLHLQDNTSECMEREQIAASPLNDTTPCPAAAQHSPADDVSGLETPLRDAGFRSCPWLTLSPFQEAVSPALKEDEREHQPPSESDVPYDALLPYDGTTKNGGGAAHFMSLTSVTPHASMGASFVFHTLSGATPPTRSPSAWDTLGGGYSGDSTGTDHQHAVNPVEDDEDETPQRPDDAPLLQHPSLVRRRRRLVSTDGADDPAAAALTPRLVELDSDGMAALSPTKSERAKGQLRDDRGRFLPAGGKGSLTKKRFRRKRSRPPFARRGQPSPQPRVFVVARHGPAGRTASYGAALQYDAATVSFHCNTPQAMS